MTWETLYSAGMGVARGASRVLGYGQSKLARGLRGRIGVVDRIEAWGRTGRRPSEPLVWLHAPSVGEGLQAKAVIKAIRSRRPDIQIAFTYFSPSAESFAASIGADFTDYLPFDVPADISRAFEALRPTLVAFTKTEIWPNVVLEAERRKIPVVLLSATLPAKSSRLNGLGRRMLRSAHSMLTHVAAISAADAERFGNLGVEESRRSVMGDSRFDQVWQRVSSRDNNQLIGDLRDETRLTIVAGSTWPPDEDLLVEAFATVANPRENFRMIIAPHEPNERHLKRLEGILAEDGVDWGRLSDVRSGVLIPPVLLVDRVGILGDLYALADVAYVGGGFGTAGLHSVLEPAAFGAPILFGPRHSNAREAEELISAGGAKSVSDSKSLAWALGTWLRDKNAREQAGARARSYIEEGLGAAERGADLVIGLVETAQR